MSQPVTTPESFFGFKLGSDRKMARWDRSFGDRIDLPLVDRFLGLPYDWFR